MDFGFFFSIFLFSFSIMAKYLFWILQVSESGATKKNYNNDLSVF